MSEIVVVGAGFVGLSFALAASECGFSVTVHDQKSRSKMPSELSSNVIAVNAASSNFLAELGVWEQIPDQFRAPYQCMCVADSTGAGAISFGAEDAGLPVLGHIVDQVALLAAMADRSDELDSLSVQWEHAAEVEVGEVPLLIAADGAHSRIREKLGLRKVGFSYHQTATVCLAEMSVSHDGCAYQWFRDSGPLALLPLSDPHRVAVVWSSFDALTELGEADFVDQLFEASEGQLGDVRSVGPRFGFPLIQQHALQYVAEGVALMGDAAHAIHPLAGQGANLGFADARALVTELSSARLEGQPLGALSVLKRYENTRKSQNHMTALAMEGFHRIFTAKDPLLGMLRSKGLNLVDGNEKLKRFAIDVATGGIQAVL